MSGKNGKRTVFIEKKVYSLWRSSWPYRMQFWKIVQTFFQEVQNCQSGSSNFRKKIRKTFSGYVICSLDNAAKKILTTSESFSIKVWKRPKNFPSFKPCSPQKVPLDCSNANLATLPQCFYKSQKRFSSRSEFEKKAISFSKTCSSLKKRFFGHVECSFDTSHGNFWPQAFKKVCKSKIYGKKHVFKKKISKLSSGPIESSFDKRLFLLKVREWQNRSSNLKKISLR